MKLQNKKALASRTFKVGKGRIIFNQSRLSEIKEAITKQDFRDLKNSGAIFLADKKGRKKVVRKVKRRRMGSVKQKPKGGKRGYIIITRKLRSYLKFLRSNKKVSKEQYLKLRNQIRNKSFKDLSHFKEKIKEGI